MVHYRPNELDTARLGVVVAKKLATRAELNLDLLSLLQRLPRQ